MRKLIGEKRGLGDIIIEQRKQEKKEKKKEEKEKVGIGKCFSGPGLGQKPSWTKLSETQPKPDQASSKPDSIGLA